MYLPIANYLQLDCGAVVEQWQLEWVLQLLGPISKCGCKLLDVDERSKCGSLTQSILEVSFQADGRLDRCV